MGELSVCGHHRDLICGICHPEPTRRAAGELTDAEALEIYRAEVRRLRGAIQGLIVAIKRTPPGSDLDAYTVTLDLLDLLDGADPFD